MKPTILLAACTLLLSSNNYYAATTTTEAFSSSRLLLPQRPVFVFQGRRRSSVDGRVGHRNIGTELHLSEDNDAEEAGAVTPDDYPLLPPETTTNDATDSEQHSSSSGTVEERTNLKRQLYQLAASYDRGFGATPKARNEADDIISQLASLNPTTNAARGIDGDLYDGAEELSDDYDEEDVPLKGIWRMVWTSAFDVVSLGASPFAAPSAIYQDITSPPIATNIIDFIPRAQTFLPSSFSPPSLLRAEVTTRASSRSGKTERVGLLFETVSLQPIELLGRKVVDDLPPLAVDLTWPRTLVEGLARFVPGLDGLGENLGIPNSGENGGGMDDDDAPGYFDVEYLDEELLIIRQQVPGGVFALVKVDNCDP